MFATFSRPPPKTPSLIVKDNKRDLERGDKDSAMELPSQAPLGLRHQVHSPITISEGEVDALASSDTESTDRGDSNEPFKPPPLHRNNIEN